MSENISLEWVTNEYSIKHTCYLSLGYTAHCVCMSVLHYPNAKPITLACERVPHNGDIDFVPIPGTR